MCVSVFVRACVCVCAFFRVPVCPCAVQSRIASFDSSSGLCTPPEIDRARVKRLSAAHMVSFEAAEFVEGV